jgi:hypothetical protein
LLDVAVHLCAEKVAMSPHQILRAGLLEPVKQHGQGIAGEAVHITRETPSEDGGGDSARACEARQPPGPRRKDLLAITQAAQGSAAHGQIARPELMEVARGAGEELAGPTIVDDGATDGFHAARVALPSEEPACEREHANANTGRHKDGIEWQGREHIPSRWRLTGGHRRCGLGSFSTHWHPQGLPDWSAFRRS